MCIFIPCKMVGGNSLLSSPKTSFSQVPNQGRSNFVVWPLTTHVGTINPDYAPFNHRNSNQIPNSWTFEFVRISTFIKGFWFLNFKISTIYCNPDIVVHKLFLSQMPFSPINLLQRIVLDDILTKKKDQKEFGFTKMMKQK